MRGPINSSSGLGEFLRRLAGYEMAIIPLWGMYRF